MTCPPRSSVLTPGLVERILQYSRHLTGMVEMDTSARNTRYRSRSCQSVRTVLALLG